MNLADVQAGPKAAQVVAAQAGVDTATAAVSAAHARLNQLLAGARSEEIRAAVADLDRARAQRDLVAAGPSDTDRQLAQQQVQQAQRQLESARDALRDAQLTAPFDGVVTDVALRRGETSQLAQPFISVGDLSRYQIETSDLDQSQLGDIAEGQSASVTFDALPGVRLPAHVVRIAPMATTGPGGTNFTLTLDLDQTHPALRWGMTSTIELQPRGVDS
jgi:HlyD family secretion protein